MEGVSYYLSGFLRQNSAAGARNYLGVGSGGGIPEAPIDGTFYGRLNANWVHAPAPSIPNADATHTGLLTSGDWSAFNAKQGALTLGNLTEATSSVLTIGGGAGAVIGAGATIQVTKSDATHAGYLSSADWNTFNGKQAAGSYLTDAPSDGKTYGRNNGVWTKTPRTFESAPLAIPLSGASPPFSGSIPHGLGAVPKLVRPVFRCLDAQAPYSVGDELDWGGWWANATGVTWYKFWANATDIHYDTEPTFTLQDMDIVDFSGSVLPMYAHFPNPMWAVVFYALT